MASPVLQFKRGALANLPGLRAGEPALTTDSFDLYVGIDSSTANNKFFGSHRYWTRGTATTGSGINLVEGTNNGTDYITVKSPNSLAGIVTYTLPGTQGAANSVLTNDGSGTLTWGSGSNNATFTGVSTFQGPVQLQSFLTAAGVSSFTDGTDNTLGNADTGAVQIDGGVGINKNLTVGANLNVQGYSEFVGVVTFRGGTINLGDSNTDNINIGGEFISNLTPNDDNTYDIGIGTQRWRNANFAGIVTATTFSGNASSADQVKTVTAGDAGANHYITFVNSHNGSATNETVYTDDGIYYNPGTNTFTTQYGYFTGNVTVDGTITGTASTATRATLVDTAGTSSNADYFVTFVDTLAGQTSETLRVGAGLSVNPSTGDVKASGSLSVGNINAVNAFIKAGGGSNALYLYSNGDVSFQAKAVVNEIRSSNNASTLITLNDLDATFARNVNIAGITTTGTLSLSGTAGIGITGISASTTLAENSDAYLPTQKAVKAYVDAVDVTLGLNADTGGPSTVNTSQTLTISGTTNEVETSVSGQTVTVGLPNSVSITTDLTTPTVKATNVKANDGTTAITITNSTGAVATNSDLTVGGNLYVNGSTTQVNTSSMTVEDRTIELGIVDGAAPSSSTTWDLGVLFNYNDGSAKKSALVWEQGDARFKLGSVISDGGGTGTTNPQITFTTYAALELGSLWINDCAGQSQVINCSAGVRTLENITIDAGTF